MTCFVKSQFHYHGGYLTYGRERVLIARLKYAQTRSKARWITFMCRHFTVEQWLAARARGEAPLTIMERKGFVLTHILCWLREGRIESWMGRTLGEIEARQ